MLSIGQVIDQHGKRILQAWMHVAQAEAASRGLRQPEVMNLMPYYLASLGSLDQEDDDVDRRRQLIASHMASRLRQGFNLDAMVLELTLLEQCIAEVVATLPPDERPDAPAVQRCFGEIHEAARYVTELFMEHLRHDEQTEKRYLRLLQDIATSSLTGTPLRQRLQEVMTLIMEATASDTAALLLYDADGGKLVMTASVGLANEMLEQYTSSVDLASFVGRVAGAAGLSTAILDAATTTLEVSDALRQSGIHAVLGVRLPAHDDLMAVMYIGVREKREFSAREIRRLEVLGYHLVIHLDNASLYGRLQDRLEALRAERALREHLVGVLAHDLRGPLTAARLAAEMLAAQPESLEARSHLATKIIQHVDRADRMLRDLLDVHQLRAGMSWQLQVARCDLSALAREVAEELTAQFGDRFSVEAPEAVEGRWSQDHLRRLLWNLATNAVKYGQEGGPVTIRVAAADDGVAVAVHNEGPPIGADEQRSLFGEFFRGPGSTSSVEPGWGLGLAFVAGCARAHGGRVEVVSLPGKGTTFLVHLPWQVPTQQSQAGADGEAPARHPELLQSHP